MPAVVLIDPLNFCQFFVEKVTECDAFILFIQHFATNFLRIDSNIESKSSNYPFMLIFQSLKYQSIVFTDRIKQGSLFDASLLYF